MAGTGGRRPVVLVTGLSGLIGRAFRAHFGDAYELRGLNRGPVDGVPTHRADIADLKAIEPAFAGVDAVVHLAALASGEAELDALLAPNIVGTYNVLEAARRAGVRRVIFASSGATVSAYEREMPYRALVEGRGAEVSDWPLITTASPVRPGNVYGATKVWGEALARYYADAHGLSAICLRIGHVNAQDRPTTPRVTSVWCSQRDVARAIAAALDAPPDLRFAVCFVTSRNRFGYRALDDGRSLLGWEPVDSADDYR